MRVPRTDTEAFSSFATALTTSCEQSEPTVVVYDVTFGENAGDNTPGLISNDASVLSVE